MSIVQEEVRAREGRTPLMQREVTGLHPTWQFRHTLNQQKVSFEDGPGKETLVNDDRSRNVYENKQNIDNMPDAKTGISSGMTSILHRIVACDGQFTVNCTSGA